MSKTQPHPSLKDRPELAELTEAAVQQSGLNQYTTTNTAEDSTTFNGEDYTDRSQFFEKGRYPPNYRNHFFFDSGMISLIWLPFIGRIWRAC